jgi:hypothetical protein
MGSNDDYAGYIELCRDSPVGVATCYGLDDRSLIPGRGKKYFSTPRRRERLLGPPSPPIQWVPGALSLGVKLPVPVADLSPSSSVEVKNGGAISPLPHMT